MTERSIRTTLSLPADLLEAVDRAVEEGRARSRNALVARAIRRELDVQARAAIDAAFAAMADDEDYRRESEMLEKEFAIGSWKAFVENEE